MNSKSVEFMQKLQYNSMSNIGGVIQEFLIKLHKEKSYYDTFYFKGNVVYFGKAINKEQALKEKGEIVGRDGKYLVVKMKKSIIFVKNSEELDKIANGDKQNIFRREQETTNEKERFYSKIFYVNTEKTIYFLSDINPDNFDFKNSSFFGSVIK